MQLDNKKNNKSVVFGIPIDQVTIKQALDTIHEAIKKHEKIQVGVVNAAKLVNMQKQKRLREDVLSSDMIIADGSAVVWASKLLGCPLPGRVTGIDLMMGLLERGHKYNYRVYCLGAKEEVSSKVEKEIKRKYPGVNIVGRYHGYFNENEEKEIAGKIKKARPDILFVAITSPKKEKFLARWSKEIDVKIAHGVGGSFDVLAGKVERAPLAWQRLGLEWLYRFKQEPRRLWKRYFRTNSIFISMLIFELIKKNFKNYLQYIG